MVSYFIRRWLACLFLVFATYNPSQYSYYHWATDIGAFSFAVIWNGILFIGAYLLGFQVLLSSIGYRGVLAGGVISVCACLEVIRLRPDTGNLHWIIETILLVIIATTLATGVSWSFLTTKLTGQKNKRYLNKEKK